MSGSGPSSPSREKGDTSSHSEARESLWRLNSLPHLYGSAFTAGLPETTNSSNDRRGVRRRGLTFGLFQQEKLSWPVFPAYSEWTDAMRARKMKRWLLALLMLILLLTWGMLRTPAPLSQPATVPEIEGDIDIVVCLPEQPSIWERRDWLGW